jgi:NAD(P)-dependent dehydrogenase (short-subunit alcohol dehydrogenase family)
LKDVKRFAHQALEAVGSGPIDYFLLNAALGPGGETLNLSGSKWREIYVVNSLCERLFDSLLVKS